MKNIIENLKLSKNLQKKLKITIGNDGLNKVEVIPNRYVKKF